VEPPQFLDAPSGCCQAKLHEAPTSGRYVGMTKSTDPFRYFDSSPEIIRLVVMMYVRYPLSLRNIDDIPFERGIDNCHETVCGCGEIGSARCSPPRSAASPSHTPVHPLALASGRAGCEDQWRAALPLAGCPPHRLRPYGAAMNEIGNAERQETGRRERRSAALGEWRSVMA